MWNLFCMYEQFPTGKMLYVHGAAGGSFACGADTWKLSLRSKETPLLSDITFLVILDPSFLTPNSVMVHLCTPSVYLRCPFGNTAIFMM